MYIHTKGSGVEVTPALKIYIEKKIGSLARFVKRWEEKGSVEAWVEIVRSKHHRHGNVYAVVADIRLPKKVLRAEHTDEDARVAIDVIQDVLKRELEHYKESRVEVLKRARRKSRGK